MTGLPTESPPPTVDLPPGVDSTANLEDLPIEDQPDEPLSKSDHEIRRSLAELDKQLIVEDFWDVLRLRQLGIASVGIMSNHITDEQLARIVAMAQAKAASRIGIMFDANEKADEGAKETLWRLSVAGCELASYGRGRCSL